MMPRSHRTSNPRQPRMRGFTLVELMIVVAIMGILATLGVDNLRQHLAHSHSAEALSTVGAIARAVHMAAERDRTSTDVLAQGAYSTSAQAAGKETGSVSGKGKGTGATVTHSPVGPGLCGDAQSVPASFTKVIRKKYQPSRAPGVDYNTGDMITGWNCLKFSVDDPQYYQYSYSTGGPPVSVKLPHGGAPPGLSGDFLWNATARGDLDGDGKESWFVLEGYVTDTGEVRAAPAIGVQDGEE